MGKKKAVKAKRSRRKKQDPITPPAVEGENVSLYYAKSFLGEWYLLTALASSRCQDNLRTSGLDMLTDHPLPMEGFDQKWRYAKFIGKFFPGEKWEGHYTGSWSEWRGMA